MITTAELFQIIDAKRQELGLSQADVGRRALQQSDGSALQNMRRGSSPTVETLSKICDALGLDLYVGPPRAVVPKVDGLSEQPAESDLGKVDAFRAGYVPLPWLDSARRSGSAPIAFAISWLEANGLIPDNLACLLPDSIRISGLTASKLLAVIDTKAARTGYGLWAIKEAGKDIVVRALFDTDCLIIQEPSLERPPRLVHDWQKSAVRPTGKVMWLGYRPDL